VIRRPEAARQPGVRADPKRRALPGRDELAAIVEPQRRGCPAYGGPSTTINMLCGSGLKSVAIASLCEAPTGPRRAKILH
jgi:hypothetical protein